VAAPKTGQARSSVSAWVHPMWLHPNFPIPLPPAAALASLHFASSLEGWREPPSTSLVCRYLPLYLQLVTNWSAYFARHISSGFAPSCAAASLSAGRPPLRLFVCTGRPQRRPRHALLVPPAPSLLVVFSSPCWLLPRPQLTHTPFVRSVVLPALCYLLSRPFLRSHLPPGSYVPPRFRLPRGLALAP